MSTRLNFKLSEVDFVRAHRVHLRRTLLTGKNVVLVSFALAIGAIQAQMFGGFDAALKIFAGLWVVVILFMLYAWLQLPGKLYRRRGENEVEYNLRYDDEGLRIDRGGVVREFSWKQVAYTAQSGGFVLLYFTSDANYGGGLPFVVPERAFDYVDDIARLHDLVRSQG